MSNTADYEQRILNVMTKKGYRPLKQRQLAMMAGMAGDEDYPIFRVALRQLASRGQVVKGRGNKYELASRSNTVVGKLVVRGTNYGYVRLGAGRGIVEINRGNFGGAMHGDIVEVEVIAVSSPDKPALGQVIKIVGAGQRRAVGTIVENRTGYYFIPIRGGVFPEVPLMTERNDIPDGELVTVEFLRNRSEGYLARIVERLGSSSEYSSTVEAILRAFEIQGEFSSGAAIEAERIQALPLNIEGRSDFRNMLTITIDPPDAKDFDDALSLDITNDGYTLYVHIADVSDAVRRGSTLDEDARARGTSVYLPGFVVPMLPHGISNIRCCLAPNEDRLAKTVILKYDSSGNRRSFEVVRSVIRSDMRLNYDEVLTVLTNPEASLGNADIDMLARSIHKLAAMLLKQRQENGSLILEMPDVRVHVDDAGNASDITIEQTDVSHSLVEECMLAANCAIAELILEKHIPGMFRTHDEPEPEQHMKLREMLLSFGIPLSKGNLRRADISDAIEYVSEKPLARVANLAILRSMKIAQYRSEVSMHYALAFQKYLHFTSPIRRYPDLFVHQQLDMLYFSTARKVEDPIPVSELALQCSDYERNAQDCERNMVNLKTIEYLARFTGQEFDAVVTGVKEFGIIVELSRFLVDALIHVKEMGGEYYNINSESTAMLGNGGTSFSPGQQVRVKIVSVDLPRRKLELCLLSAASDGSNKKKRKEKNRSKKSVKSARKGTGGKNGARRRGK